MVHGHKDYSTLTFSLISRRDTQVEFLLILILLLLSPQLFATRIEPSGDASTSGETPRLPNSILTQGTSAVEDTLRKELIKAQILHRLGLNEKPQVDLAHKISRDLVLETLRRTETISTTEAAEVQNASYYQQEIHTNTSGRKRHNQTKLLDESSDIESLANYAKTAEIISFPEKGPVLNGETLLSFSFAGNNAYGVGVRVKKAHLWVKMDYKSSIGRHFGHLLHPKGITLYVFQVQGNFTNQPQQLSLQDVSLDLVVSRTIFTDSLGWQKFDVTQLVQKWYGKLSRHRIRHPNSHHHQKHRSQLKLTLLIDCSRCGYSIHPVSFSHKQESESDMVSSSTAMSPRMESDENNDLDSESKLSGKEAGRDLDHLSEMPFLVLETESTSPQIKRSRRRALECSPRVKQCCKQKFFVSFRELGWDDWIIAPRGYYANYCRGHCGGIHRTPDTFLNYHTHVMEEYRRTAAGQIELNGLTPCCSPTKFSAMSLIYFGPELNIIKRDLPKMIVEECGCP